MLRAPSKEGRGAWIAEEGDDDEIEVYYLSTNAGEEAFWTSYLEESKQNALYLQAEETLTATPGLAKQYRPSTHRPIPASRRLALFNLQVAAIQARGYASPKDEKRHAIHVKWRKANQRKLEAAAAIEAMAPEHREEERVGKRVQYLYGRSGELEGKFDVRKHPGVRTPGLFEDVDVGEQAWRERVEVEGMLEEEEEVGERKDEEGVDMLEDEGYFSDECQGAVVGMDKGVKSTGEDDGFLVVSAEAGKGDETAGRDR
jgi:hypothetical protein